MIIVALVIIAKIRIQPKCSLIDKWTKKMLHTHAHTHTHTHTLEYYSVIRNEVLSFATRWMDLECTMLSETSQRNVNRIPLIGGI